jgi:hypothetical protein
MAVYAIYAIVNQIFGTGHTQHDWNMTLHDEQQPTGYGAAMPDNASIEYFPAPVMHNSKKPPIRPRSL